MTLPLVVHVTHEAALKIGGIGAVLEGLLGAHAYNRAVTRTILAGPFPIWDASQMDRIVSARSRLRVRYASRYGVFGLVEPDLGRRLLQVEQELNIGIFYATASYGRYEHEVLLVDPSGMDRQDIHTFSYVLWEQYGVDVARYGYDLEWQGFVDLALPLARALEALTALEEPRRTHRFLVAHDWMGLPTAFAARMLQPQAWSLLFHAHEVAPVRRLVEEHEGHDTRFYNVMRAGRDAHMYLDNIFGSQHDYCKVPLLHQAARCDTILAVSELTVEELHFLGADFQQGSIDLVYNGIPAQTTTLAEKQESRARLQAYCQNLLGYRPDYILSHVTRMVMSKGLWRDARVLAHLAHFLYRDGQTAVLFVLSTSLPTGRAPDRIRQWEQAYGWPVSHWVDNGDLLGDEIPFFFDVVEPFNRFHANVKIVFVNQFGWDRARCGLRMPADMTFDDLRVGTDVEFGQSIYEPFGIAQLEPLTQGAICCTSSACGCRGFIQQVRHKGLDVPLYTEADYIALPDTWWSASPGNALDIDRNVRNRLEESNSFEAARRIHALLPRDEETRTRYLETGQAASRAMSWEIVAAQYFVPALARVQAQAEQHVTL